MATAAAPDSEIKVRIGKMIFYITCVWACGSSIGSPEFSAPAKQGHCGAGIF